MTDHVNTPSSAERITFGPPVEKFFLAAALFGATCWAIGAYKQGHLTKDEPKITAVIPAPSPAPGK